MQRGIAGSKMVTFNGGPLFFIMRERTAFFESVTARDDHVTTRWVALLRGINVGRNKRIAMADVRAMLESLGNADVRTLGRAAM